MSFKTFIQLYEGEYLNKATLIYQAFIDNLETTHYNKGDNYVSFNIGKAAKIAKFSDLELVIREASTSSVRLAKRKSGNNNFAVVIEVRDIPQITELAELLENPKVMRPATGAIEKYLNLKRSTVSDSDDSYLTDYEKVKRYNEKEVFEDHYQQLVKKLQEKYSELRKMLDNFEKQIEKTDNSSRKVTLEMAAEKLKNDYIGKSYKDFQSKAFKLLDEINKDFRENLEKDKKKILEDRLKQFYEELQ